MTRYKAEEEKLKEAQDKAKDLLEKVTDQIIIASKKPAVDILVAESVDEIQPIEEFREDDENWVKQKIFIIYDLQLRFIIYNYDL